MIKKILFLTIFCFASSLDEFIKIENFHPPNGYQPVKGYEPPNYIPNIQQTQRFNFEQNYYGQNYENYEPRNQYENNQYNQNQHNYQQPYQPPNQYQNNYQQNNQYQYNNNNPQNLPNNNNMPSNNYQTNNNGNNWGNNNQNNQWIKPASNQNNNDPDGWRRTAPPTKFTTTTKWTGWTDTTTKYAPPAPPALPVQPYQPVQPFPQAPAVYHPVTAPPILVTPPPQPPQTTTGTTTVDWRQVFLNSASTAKTNYIEAVQNVHNNNNNNGVFGVDDHCLKCLCFIESWCSDVGCVLDQGSLSCGWYQLKYEYWLDCGQPGGGWKECSNSKSCAEGCVKSYMNRYSSFCGLGSSCPHLGRIHNGGPQGCSNNNTEYYGWLIERCLKRQAPYEKIDTFKIPN